MSTLQPIDPEAVNLGIIKAPAVVSAKPSETYDREIRELESQRKRLHNLELKQKIGARRLYVLAIFVMVVAWIVGIYVLLVMEGFNFRGFNLSSNLLLAAIGSTTANVLALLFMIVKFLFSEKGEAR